MTVSEKQKIYLDIMSLVLPVARNVQTWGGLQRLRTNLYPELELVHGLPGLVEESGFSKGDVYWINTQGVNFINHYRDRKARFFSVEIVEKIYYLSTIFPDELKMELAGEIATVSRPNRPRQ